ncbi:sensor domain-containing protein [Streptomyces sp. AV19]|uniref:sensor histidine kinase n=1 Tax=Streptomyces sp. AV19 TaxID=2793068 RepID=UPI0018FE1040|nr:sensor domain-containing protein [Streptomyces sp. AV19]MBH1933503.1 sensor domain-containing protein [Streptomyces sp. AV19]MDG4532152.1 sensor domain-containing protein [Streptomyces sp. AV19]
MRIRTALQATARSLWLALWGLVSSILLFTLAVCSIALIPAGVGVLTAPYALKAVRHYANQRRLYAMEWSGVSIPVPYRPLPERGGLMGHVERLAALLKDKATWRDLQWLLVDMTAGFTLSILPPVLFLYFPWGIVLACGVWKPIVEAGGNEWFAFIHITGQTSANLAAGLGAVFAVLGFFTARPLLRANFTLARQLLHPDHERELELRVQRLTETREDAVDHSAAELRRIERDLHDGAQARLVAMGMSLGTIEALIERDPAQAKRLLAAARADSAEALTELRDLVRGIHPPVLAERGLGDAVRALALRMPLPVEVTVDLPGRAAEPVESAAYFAVSEVLTNAVKHAEATRVRVDVYHADGMLRVAVTDDGRGGADTSRGTGLLGIERRLGAFDGVLAISSPAGGPTLVTVEIPCALAASAAG